MAYKTQSSSVSEPVNPYRISKDSVKLSHFKDARLYDADIHEEGWEVPKSEAKREQKRWLRSVRRKPGMELFRIPTQEIIEEVQNDNGGVDLIRRLVPKHSKQANGEEIKNDDGTITIYKRLEQKSTTQPQKKIHAKPKFGNKKFTAQHDDSDDHVVKMFTFNMGREIAQCRNALNLTQAQLAQKINVDVAMIRNIELGDLISFNSEDPMVRALAKALGKDHISYQA